MSRREKKMRTKRKSIKKDEDKEEKEKPSAGLCALIYSTPLSFIIYGQCDGCVKKSGKIGMIFFTFGG